MKNKPVYDCFIKGVGAGIILSLAGIASLIAGTIPINATLALFIKSCVFPIGLIAIVFSNYSLYTSAVATLGAPFDFTNWYFYKLISVWFGNLIGSVIGGSFIFLGTYTKYKAAIEAVVIAKCSINPLIIIGLGVACNFLICLGVTTAKQFKTDTSKIAILFISVFLFMICGFEHSIANMFYFVYGVFNRIDVSIGSMIVDNLIPVTIGNFIGGKLFTMLDNQIKSE